ncbi:MAG: DUF624 domain-containing protein [Lachnospiraceae bacterium]|nr:DUF624 domain-containing protein [Lachnospiraceae bacterium]
MKNLFSMDGGLFRFLSGLADMMILNIIFLICCIPVVTIGAAVTSLSYVMLKMRDNEEGYIVRSFFKAFKMNFKQSTLIWLMLLFFAVVLGLDFYLLSNMTGMLAQVMRVLVYMGGIIWLMIFLYVFPLQSRFYNSIRNTLKNAVLLSLANFPKTLSMIVLVVAAVVVTMWNGTTFWYGLLFWFMFGFATIAFLNSFLLHGILKKMMPKEEDEAEEGKEESI